MIKVIYDPGAPKETNHNPPKEDNHDYNPGTIVEDEAGVSWENVESTSGVRHWSRVLEAKVEEVVVCPMCGAFGDEVCIRGRQGGAIWGLKRPATSKHASRVKLEALVKRSGTLTPLK